MKVTGLKFMSDKGWTADNAFQSDSGKMLTIPANHKCVCTDEDGDVVNVTIVTPAPLVFKAGEELKNVKLVGSVSKSGFGWALKCQLS